MELHAPPVGDGGDRQDAVASGVLYLGAGLVVPYPWTYGFWVLGLRALSGSCSCSRSVGAGRWQSASGR